MSYVTRQDLVNFVSGLTTDNDRIIPGALNDIRKKVCYEIDLRLDGIYEVPIDPNRSPKAFSVLKFIGIDLAREHIAYRLDAPLLEAIDVKQTIPWMYAVKKANERIHQIVNGTFPLVDAVKCEGCRVFASGDYDTDCVDSKPMIDLYESHVYDRSI